MSLVWGLKLLILMGFLKDVVKGRRHLKLFTVMDIEEKCLAYYLPLALEAMEEDA